jgi:hypothetical protein
MPGNRITLPAEEEMVARLRSVFEEQRAVCCLYPKIAAHAGEQIAPEGLSVMLLLAIADYADGNPSVEITLSFFIPAFITALTAPPGGS